jgi:hypothetical protein
MALRVRYRVERHAHAGDGPFGRPISVGAIMYGSEMASTSVGRSGGSIVAASEYAVLSGVRDGTPAALLAVQSSVSQGWTVPPGVKGSSYSPEWIPSDSFSATLLFVDKLSAPDFLRAKVS